MKTINYITCLLVLMIVSCGSNQTKTKYYNISFESNTNFPVETSKKSISLVRVIYLDSKIKVDIIKNDSIFQSVIYPVRNDTLIGEINSIEDYTYRLLFPELNMKVSNKKTMFNDTGIIEIRNKEEWIMYKEWGIGLTSKITGRIEIGDATTTLKTTASINTPARLFSGKSTTIIKEMNGLELLNFDLKWEDCM